MSRQPKNQPLKQIVKGTGDQETWLGPKPFNLDKGFLYLIYHVYLFSEETWNYVQYILAIADAKNTTRGPKFLVTFNLLAPDPNLKLQ